VVLCFVNIEPQFELSAVFAFVKIMSILKEVFMDLPCFPVELLCFTIKL
jgi:hypothetical protein